MDNTPGNKLGIWRDMRLVGALVRNCNSGHILKHDWSCLIDLLAVLSDHFTLSDMPRTFAFQTFPSSFLQIFGINFLSSIIACAVVCV